MCWVEHVHSACQFWRTRRWAETDGVLVPRGESEEETLVGSFTKLLVMPLLCGDVCLGRTRIAAVLTAF